MVSGAGSGRRFRACGRRGRPARRAAGRPRAGRSADHRWLRESLQGRLLPAAQIQQAYDLRPLV